MGRMDAPQSDEIEKHATDPVKLASMEINPPLPMQTSSHLTSDGLDIGHGGGGIQTSVSSDTTCNQKKRKYSEMCNGESMCKSVDYSDNDNINNDVELLIDEEEVEEVVSINGDVNDTSRQQLEFDILDELEVGGAEEANSGSQSDTDSDIPVEEIESMLDEGLESYKKGSNPTDSSGDGEFEVKQKVLLKVRSRDHFDVLPEGWIEIAHNSGMPVYLHKQSRVCSLSRPYFLGPGSARKHEVPISSIPCLHYNKLLEKERLEKEQAEKEEQAKKEGQTENANLPEEEMPPEQKEVLDGGLTGKEGLSNGGNLPVNEALPEALLLEKGEHPGSKANHVKGTESGIAIPPAKVESMKESKKESSLDYMAVREYCQRLFEFHTVTYRKFKTWSEKRKNYKMMKQRPTLPDETKLITCVLPSARERGHASGNASKKEFMMNPSGKSFVCVLHEYVQLTMRVQPRYIFKELESPTTPYGATVIINDMQYASGVGGSKKQAKLAAAKATLEILIPQMKEVINENQAPQDLSFFDEVRVEDPRVNELCVKVGQPQPYQLLLECLRRNYGMGDTEIKMEMTNIRHQKNEFFMTVGKHNACVICRNKRDGKQRAAQAILQALHPHVNSWGSLLRLYGRGSFYTLKEKKEEEQKITELQSKACANKPNLSILNKLKEEMLKLKDKKESLKPIGKFIPEEMILPSTSSSNLKNVEL